LSHSSSSFSLCASLPVRQVSCGQQKVDRFIESLGIAPQWCPNISPMLFKELKNFKSTHTINSMHSNNQTKQFILNCFFNLKLHLRGQMKKVKKGEYGWCIFYTCMNMEHWNTLKLF
jgi:hypothetical protein